MICVSISQSGDIGKALAQGARLLELRLDLLKSDPTSLYSWIPKGIRTVATCRPGPFDEKKRLALLKEAMDLGATYVDVELESGAGELRELIGYARSRGTEVIVSHHDFDKTPSTEELEALVGQCYDKGGDVAKVATRVNTRDDLIRLFSLYRGPGRKVIVGMGALGRMVRVAAPYLGAEFTFASLGGGTQTAPGQLGMDELTKIYQIIDSQ
ncbi:MAG: type I 3-dehydroquinate dehydratase [Bacteroidales bacterium]